MINYYLLTKPGIIIANLITFTAGFFLATSGHIDLPLFFFTLLGLGFVIASACTFNNYIDQVSDKKMERTKDRPLVNGALKGKSALLFGACLWVLGNALFLCFSNPLAAVIANIGFAIYVFLYSFLKYKTTYSTLIGSLSGAIPPVVGYVAVTHRIDTAALLLFMTMVFWQMPHFYSIAIWHIDDYSRAKIPLLPIVKGIHQTKIQTTLYILGLIPLVSLFTYLGFTGELFLVLTVTVSVLWALLSIRGFFVTDHQRWGRQMFRTSLVMINIVCFLLIFLRP